jgi:hypothetical protein
MWVLFSGNITRMVFLAWETHSTCGLISYYTTQSVLVVSPRPLRLSCHFACILAWKPKWSWWDNQNLQLGINSLFKTGSLMGWPKPITEDNKIWNSIFIALYKNGFWRFAKWKKKLSFFHLQNRTYLLTVFAVMILLVFVFKIYYPFLKTDIKKYFVRQYQHNINIKCITDMRKVKIYLLGTVIYRGLYQLLAKMYSGITGGTISPVWIYQQKNRAATLIVKTGQEGFYSLCLHCFE